MQTDLLSNIKYDNFFLIEVLIYVSFNYDMILTLNYFYIFITINILNNKSLLILLKYQVIWVFP